MTNNKKFKKIPDKVIKDWHSTGTRNHIFQIGVSDSAKHTCIVCGVNTRGESYGCQGMKFKDWLKAKYQRGNNVQK